MGRPHDRVQKFAGPEIRRSRSSLCGKTGRHVGEPARRGGGHRRPSVRRLCTTTGNEGQGHRTAGESLGSVGADPSDSSSWGVSHARGGNDLAAGPVDRCPRRSTEDGGVACQRRGPPWSRASAPRGTCHGAAWFERPVPWRRPAPCHSARCRSLPVRWPPRHRRCPHHHRPHAPRWWGHDEQRLRAVEAAVGWRVEMADRYDMRPSATRLRDVLQEVLGRVAA